MVAGHFCYLPVTFKVFYEVDHGIKWSQRKSMQTYLDNCSSVCPAAVTGQCSVLQKILHVIRFTSVSALLCMINMFVLKYLVHKNMYIITMSQIFKQNYFVVASGTMSMFH